MPGPLLSSLQLLDRRYSRAFQARIAVPNGFLEQAAAGLVLPVAQGDDGSDANC